jgi:hypothetical protein
MQIKKNDEKKKSGLMAFFIFDFLLANIFDYSFNFTLIILTHPL